MTLSLTNQLNHKLKNTYRPVVNPVGSADAKLLPAPRLLGVVSDKIGVTSVALPCTHTHRKHPWSGHMFVN